MFSSKRGKVDAAAPDFSRPYLGTDRFECAVVVLIK